MSGPSVAAPPPNDPDIPVPPASGASVRSVKSPSWPTLREHSEQLRALRQREEQAVIGVLDLRIEQGRILKEVRGKIRSQTVFGRYLKAQGLPYTTAWARTLRLAAENELLVRRLFASQLATRSEPNFETLVELATKDKNLAKAVIRREKRLGDALKELKPATPKQTNSTSRYYTDAKVINAAKRAMGGSIDFDPASCEEANTTVGAAQFLTVDDDGLSQDWKGRVWLNPPFGVWEHWASKILAEWHSGRAEQMCVIVPTRSLTAKSLAPLLAEMSALWVFTGRLPFGGPDATSTPPDGHVLVYFGPRTTEFRDACADLGVVLPGTWMWEVAPARTERRRVEPGS